MGETNQNADYNNLLFIFNNFSPEIMTSSHTIPLKNTKNQIGNKRLVIWGGGQVFKFIFVFHLMIFKQV